MIFLFRLLNNLLYHLLKRRLYLLHFTLSLFFHNVCMVKTYIWRSSFSNTQHTWSRRISKCKRHHVFWIDLLLFGLMYLRHQIDIYSCEILLKLYNLISKMFLLKFLALYFPLQLAKQHMFGCSIYK